MNILIKLKYLYNYNCLHFQIIINNNINNNINNKIYSNKNKT